MRYPRSVDPPVITGRGKPEFSVQPCVKGTSRFLNAMQLSWKGWWKLEQKFVVVTCMYIHRYLDRTPEVMRMMLKFIKLASMRDIGGRFRRKMVYVKYFILKKSINDSTVGWNVAFTPHPTSPHPQISIIRPPTLLVMEHSLHFFCGWGGMGWGVTPTFPHVPLLF